MKQLKNLNHVLSSLNSSFKGMKPFQNIEETCDLCSKKILPVWIIACVPKETVQSKNMKYLLRPELLSKLGIVIPHLTLSNKFIQSFRKNLMEIGWFRIISKETHNFYKQMDQNIVLSTFSIPRHLPWFIQPCKRNSRLTQSIIF